MRKKQYLCTKFLTSVKKSAITYYPKLSIKENAIRNNCTEASIKWYIHAQGIDRQYDKKVRMIQLLRLAYKDGMTAYGLAQASKKSINTIKKYWNFIIGEEELSRKYSKKQQKLTLRQNEEFYATHPSVVKDLLREMQFNRFILEPAAGMGHLFKEITAAGYKCLATDLIDRKEPTVQGGVDFLEADFEVGKYDIITNPPYDLFIPFIKKVLEIAKDKVAFLLPMRYLSSKSRYKIYQEYPPRYVYVYIEDILLARNGEFEKYHLGSRETYAWYIWEKEFKGAPTIKWIHNICK